MKLFRYSLMMICLIRVIINLMVQHFTCLYVLFFGHNYYETSTDLGIYETKSILTCVVQIKLIFKQTKLSSSEKYSFISLVEFLLNREILKNYLKDKNSNEVGLNFYFLIFLIIVFIFSICGFCFLSS